MRRRIEQALRQLHAERVPDVGNDERTDFLHAFLRPEQEEVIAVAEIVLDVKLLLHVLVELVHVEVAEPLTDIVSDGNAVRAVDDVGQEVEPCP